MYSLTSPSSKFRLFPTAAALLLSALLLSTGILLSPFSVLLATGAFIAVVVITAVIRNLIAWQLLVMVIVVGYIVLDYGFTNWIMPVAGIPVPIGYLFIAAASGIAVFRYPRFVGACLRNRIMRCWLVLLLISAVHLLNDIPSYGAFAVRDASFVAEGVVFILGYVWARTLRQLRVFIHVLLFLLCINLIYSFLYPAEEVLLAVSRIPGVFREVSLLGNYVNTPVFLVLGAVFCLLFAKEVSGNRSLIFWLLALLQIGWSLVFQSRSMYLGIILAAVVLVFFSWSRKEGLKTAGWLILGLPLFFLVIVFFEVQIPGRVGQVNFDFLVGHFQSIFLVPDTPAEGSAQWRVQLYGEIWARWTRSISEIVVGEGFGEPLIDFAMVTGVAVRQPHNTHITVLMRLGLIGFCVWGLMLYRIFSSLLRSLRHSRNSRLLYNVYLWFFIFYLIGMLFTSVQPWLEFSYGSVPFFTLIGFAVGLADNRKLRELPGGKESQVHDGLIPYSGVQPGAGR